MRSRRSAICSSFRAAQAGERTQRGSIDREFDRGEEETTRRVASRRRHRPRTIPRAVRRGVQILTDGRIPKVGRDGGRASGSEKLARRCFRTPDNLAAGDARRGGVVEESEAKTEAGKRVRAGGRAGF